MSIRTAGARARSTSSALLAVMVLTSLATVTPASAEDPIPSTVWGWGRNFSGQLGDGSAGMRVLPERVLVGMTAIGAGDQHSLSVDSQGAAWSWGSNGDGQLGDGTDDDRGVPELMSGLDGVGAIADVDGGTDHSILLTADGRVFGVGRNRRGQLGNGTIVDSRLPVPTSGLPAGIRAISAGGNHNLALDPSGRVWAWGDNGVGQLGTSGETHRTVAAPVPGLPPITDISAAVDGSSNAALDADGNVWTWGANFTGELGDGTTDNRSAPAMVALPDVVEVSAGDGYTVALGASGEVYGWGNNSAGQLGDGTTDPRLTPVTVAMPPGVQLDALSTGGAFTIALDQDGGVWAWGLNNLGYLGDGTTTQRTTPGPVLGLPQIVAIDAGHGHSLALDADGGLWAWGYNSNGQLGDHSVRQRSAATRTRPMPTPASLWAGEEHTLALTAEGELWAWGGNAHGQLGDGTAISRGVPQPVPGLAAGVTTAAAGDNHSLAVRDGGVLAWGDNLEGQLGDGTTVGRHSPVAVTGLPLSATAVSAGYRHSTALLADGSVWAWGANAVGQLGDGTSTSRSTAGAVPGLNDVVALAAGYDHTLALRSDGTVWAWGHGAGRQPQPVAGIPPMASVAAGMRFSLGRARDGSVWAWGENGDGQLGTDPGGVGTGPRQVPGVSDAIAVDAGEHHSLALLGSGSVLAWGMNSQGQLGDGSYTSSSTPRQVLGVTDAVTIAAGGAFSLAVAGPERRTEATTAPGGTVTSDPDGYGATRSDPLQTSVTSPTGGLVTLTEQPVGAPPSGFALVGKQVEISAPPASPEAPLLVVFEIDASVVPVGEDAQSLQVLRDGAIAAACTDVTAAVPDPCIFERTNLPTGNIRIGVRTSHASLWSIAVRTATPNLEPTVENASVAAALVPVGTTVSASAGFLDGDLADSHRATWDWGDGTVCVTGLHPGCALEASPGGGTTTAEHAYTAPGTYTVTVTIRDGAGAEATTAAGVVEVHALPTETSQCKNGGWRTFHFRSQGQCVSWLTSSARAGQAR